MPITKSLFDPAKIAAAIFYAGLGLAVFGLAFTFVDKKTPYHLWNEIVGKQNQALAIVVAGLSIAMAIIVAAAIVG